MCPGATGANMTIYKTSYVNLMATFEKKADFPRITGASISLPQGSICPRSVDSSGMVVSWPAWNTSGVNGGASCHRVDLATSVATATIYQGGDVDSMCYACTCTIEETVEALGSNAETYCEQFESDKKTANNWGLFATIVVVLVNQILKQTIVFTAPVLKAHTQEEEMSSKVLRIFLCQLTNTAILILLTKSAMPPFDEMAGEHYENANAKWYANIAAPMLVTMVIQFITPPAFHFIMHFGVGFLVRVLKINSSHTQNQLNAAIAPKDRDFAAGYGEILLAMSVTLLFGPAVPVLYFIASAGFALRFCVERWCDLRIYGKPPLYSKKLIGSFDNVLLVLAALHCLMSCYLISVAGAATPAAKVDFDASRPHTIPMVCTVAIAFVLLTFKILAMIPGLYPKLRALPGAKQV